MARSPLIGSNVAKGSLRQSLLPLLALALMMAVGFAMLGSFGTVQEGAKAELGLSDYSMGVIQGVGAAVPLVLFSIPIGILVDRFNRTCLMIALAVVWTAGTALTALAAGTATLFVARMLVGIGTTGALTAALSLGADLCATSERGRAMLIVSVGKSLGIALGFAAAGALYGLFLRSEAPISFGGLLPWRSVHLVLAAISAVMIAPLFLMREPARREVAAATNAPFHVILGELWNRRAFLLPLFVGQASVVMADNAAMIWASPVLSRSFGLRPDQFAAWMGLLLFAANVLGTFLGGIAADLGQKSARPGGLLVGAVAAATVGVPAALFPISPGIEIFAVALGVLAMSGSITGVITSVALTVLIPNELRGFCIGAFIAVAGLIGFGVAPTLVTLVSGTIGGEAHVGQALAIVGVVVSAISVVAFRVAMRRAPASALTDPI